MSELVYALSDLTLSRRLERCEGKANAAFVRARAKLQPEIGARAVEHAGAYALFDGPDSPVTQTFALGLFATPTNEDMEVLESIAPFHEVSPMASIETMQLLVARGYHPIELSSVLHQPISISATAATEGRIRTRIAAPDEIELWSEIAAEGWSEFPEVVPFVRAMGRVAASAEGTTPFFAELDGRPIGTGALAMHDGVAQLAGASTIPSARKQGAQRALLATRLRYAAEHGCDLATMATAPGSASQRNAERQGFRIAYTRLKWGR